MTSERLEGAQPAHARHFVWSCSMHVLSAPSLAQSAAPGLHTVDHHGSQARIMLTNSWTLRVWRH